MRKGIYSVFAAVVLICLFAVSSAKAQSTNRVVFRADIPFEFMVGKVRLPAGEYTVKNVSDSSDILQLTSTDRHAGVLIQKNSIYGKTDERAKLIFSRYGNHYFFSQAWMPATRIGLEALKSGAQRAIERELATTGPRIEEIALTVRR
jgi:hypothetical protein